MAQIKLPDASSLTDDTDHLARHKLRGTNSKDLLPSSKLHGIYGTTLPIGNVDGTDGAEHSSRPKSNGTDGTDHPLRHKLRGTDGASVAAPMAQIALPDASSTAHR